MKKILLIISILALTFLTACNKTESPTADAIKKADNMAETPIVENTEKVATNFLECESMGGAIMESYPRQCSLGDLVFTEILEIDESESNSKDTVEETINIEDSKAELQQAFKDIEKSMEIVDDNMQAMDIDDSELDSIGF